MESRQLNRLETAVHNVTMRLVQMGKKVACIETEMARRRVHAAKRRKQRHRARVQGTLSMPEYSFRPDERLPYDHWARVCFEFGLRGMHANEFCRWVVVEWIRQYKLHARKKVLSLTSGRIRYFANGVQCSCAEVDMFGRKHMHRRARNHVLGLVREPHAMRGPAPARAAGLRVAAHALPHAHRLRLGCRWATTSTSRQT